MVFRRLVLLALFAATPALAQPHGAPPPPDGPPAPLTVDRPYDGPDEWLFISPAGEPFRARIDQPYPVAAWFARADKNGDGALTQAEFVADALVFFDQLDTDKDGKIDGFENSAYEKEIAPEISGVMRRPDAGGRKKGWNPFSRADGRGSGTGRQGAGQYGLLNEPHPVRGGDADLDQRVSRAEAEAAARNRFQLLDTNGDGRLTLSELPKTPAQIALAPPQEKR